jgi:hypothetical protein
MNPLSAEAAKSWCEGYGVHLPEKLAWDGRFRPTAPRESLPIRFEIPKDAGKRVSTCKGLFAPLRDQAILIWYDDWSVWPSGEWLPMFERFRAAFGVTQPLIERPAYLFEASEIEDALSFFIFAALFLWDCHVITEREGYSIFISHDEYGLSKLPKGRFA